MLTIDSGCLFFCFLQENRIFSRGKVEYRRESLPLKIKNNESWTITNTGSNNEISLL